MAIIKPEQLSPGSYNITGSFAGSFTGSLFGTASYATQTLTASYFSGSVPNAISASYASTASYVSTVHTLQNIIDVSSQPQGILDNTTGAIQLKNTQTSMTSSTQEWLDDSSNVVGKITGQGELSLVVSYITVELIDVLTTNFYAPNDLSIESVINLLNVPSTTILVNDIAYVLGNPITSGDKITVTVDIAAVVKLVINNVI